MTRVFVVGSVHEEKGLANVMALVGILVRLKPEVIFREIPASLSEEQAAANRRETLETCAVELYRRGNSVKLVSVDLPTPKLDFFTNNGYFLQKIEKVSQEFCRLMDWHSQYVREYGFPYLNSDHCNKLWDEIDQEMTKTVIAMNEQRLTDLHDLWNHTIESRDFEMVTNIRKYCAENTFERGVFLVGTSHRRSIRKKVADLNNINKSEIVWDFMESENGSDDATGA